MGQKIRRIGLSLICQKYLWTLIAFITIVGFLDPNSFWQRYKLYAQNEALKLEIKKYEERYERDTKELNELENNPEAVERVARVNLYMKTADEDVYVIDDSTTP